MPAERKRIHLNETARAVLTTRPQSQAADAQFVKWLMDHQKEAGVLELSRDRAWLVKMTNTVCQHWQRQNVKRKSRSLSVSPSGSSPVVALSS